MEERATYLIPVPGLDDGTEVEMYAPTPEEATVIGRATFDLIGRGPAETKGRSFLSLARIVDRLIVKAADKILLEDLMLEGVVPADKMMEILPDLLKVHGETISEQQVPTNGPKKAVRRR